MEYTQATVIVIHATATPLDCFTSRLPHCYRSLPLDDTGVELGHKHATFSASSFIGPTLDWLLLQGTLKFD